MCPWKQESVGTPLQDDERQSHSKKSMDSSPGPGFVGISDENNLGPRFRMAAEVRM